MSDFIRIRPFQEPDYAATVALYKRAPAEEWQDFEYDSEVGLRDFDACFNPSEHVLQRFVAEDTSSGEIVGAAQLFHMPWLADPSRYWCAVRVDPSRRRGGIGARLYARLVDDLTRRDARAIRLMARESTPDLALALVQRGCVELLRSWDFELDLTSATLPPEAPGRGPPEPPIPLPEVMRLDPTWLDKLHALYQAVLKDVPIPGVPRADLPLSWLADHLLRWPSSLPEACFVVIEEGRYVGLSVAHKSGEDSSKMNQLLTGVAPGLRGRGVGVALKRASIKGARSLGFRRIWTGVESNNPKMIAINEAFGFVRTGGLILFEKILGDNNRIQEGDVSL